MVFETLKERGLLLQNAPHLVKNQSFLIPNYNFWEHSFYGIGLKIYDWMAGGLSMGSTKFLSKTETLKLLPTLNSEGLNGGIIYHDGQFDDARLAIHLAMTAADYGATLVNYFSVDMLLKADEKICGVLVSDSLTNSQHEVKAKIVINATGVFVDSILKMDDENAKPTLAPSQGIHLMLDKKFLASETAILIPKTDDGRILFAVPWHNKTIVGTTDTPTEKPTLEPIAFQEEIDFILKHIGRYLTTKPTHKDIKSVFAGLRPLLKNSNKITASLKRDHQIKISKSNLITIAGGKWTSYRKMAEDVMKIACSKIGLPYQKCVTKKLHIHGYKNDVNFEKALYYYGSDEHKIHSLIENNKELNQLIHPSLPYIKAEIIWAVQNEMCITVEDALSRRTRALQLDAKAAMEATPTVANLMAIEMNKDENWIKEQINIFISVAKNYLPHSN